LKSAIIFLLFISTLVYSKENFLKIGLGGFFRKDIYNFEDKYQFYPLPAVALEYSDFYFIAPLEAGYHFYQNEDLRLTVYGRYRLFTGYDQNDFKDYLKNMDDRKDDLHLGLRGRIFAGPTKLIFTGTVSTDILNKSNGTLAGLEMAQPLPLGKKTLVAPFVGIQYLSKNYTDYYYGITDHESEKLTNIDSYSPDSSYKIVTGIKGYSNITDNVELLFSGEYSQYSDEISDSPLTRGDSNFSFIFGISYKFGF
jgi:outer membrane protein